MALTINNFWGAETGTLDEAISGSTGSVVADDVRSGHHAYYLGSGENVRFEPFVSVSSAGNNHIIGFAANFFDSTPSSNYVFMTAGDSSNSGHFSLRLNTSGTLSIRDNSDSVVGTSSSAVFTSKKYSFVEIYIVSSGTVGYAEVFVDGINVITTSATEDFLGLNPLERMSFFGSVLRVDDLYWMSGATSADDRLGDCAVYAYRGAGAQTGDWTVGGGGTLDAGTFSNTQQDPWSDSLTASLTDKVARGMGVDTDNLGGNIPALVHTEVGMTDPANTSGAAAGAYMSPDGLNYYLTNITSGGDLLWYELTVAWDLSTAVYQDKMFITGVDTSGIFFNDAGTKFWSADQFTAEILYQYSLSTAWDISTATKDTDEFDLSSVTTNPAGLTFNPAGTRLYISNSGGNVSQFILSTAWDITSIQTPADATWSTQSMDMWWESDGEAIWITAGGTTEEVRRYTVSTAWDLGSTVTLDQSADLAPATKDARGIVVNDTLDVVFINGWEDGWQWDLASAGQIAETGGPNGDGHVTYDEGIVAMKGAWRMSRSGGGGTTQYGLLGNTGTAIGTGDRTPDLNIDTSPANYFMIKETNLPLSTEELRIGFEKDGGGQDLVCQDMLAQILYVPEDIPPAAPPPFNPIRTYQHLLVR